MSQIKQYVSQNFCLGCLGCCRYNSNSSIWMPHLLEEEKKRLNLKKIELVYSRQSYICRFLNLENNRCNIYNQRPLECQIYPFLLNRVGSKLFLSLDLGCAYVKDKSDSQEFKNYLDCLIEFFKQQSVLNTIRKNRQIFSTYPKDKILNLEELEI